MNRVSRKVETGMMAISPILKDDSEENITMTLDDSKMMALETYITWERRGIPLEPGKY